MRSRLLVAKAGQYLASGARAALDLRDDVERHYMETVRHFPQESLWAFLLGDLLPAYLVLGLGLFGLYSELHQWPKMISRHYAEP
jgi:hypothetical protein